MYKVLKYLVVSFVIYNLVNYIWYEVSYSDLKTGINSTLKYFGIIAYRVNFPMASGPTTNAAQVGITSLLILYLFAIPKRIFQSTGT